MPSLSAKLVPWIRALLGADATVNRRPLEEYLSGIPRLNSLADVPRGTPVLVRGDLDAKPGAKIGEGDIRLRSMLETLRYGQERGWKQVVFGHIGRKPEGSLKSVAKRLGELLGTTVPLIDNWYDEASQTVPDHVTKTIADSAPGSVLMLENTRKFPIERVLWNASPDDAQKLAEPLAKFAEQLAEKVADIYVNEALSAGSLDSSSTIVPAAMKRSVLGAYVASEFDGPMGRCLRTQMVVFSGLKTDKLDDLEAMIQRGTIRVVFTAGSLAMALEESRCRVGRPHLFVRTCRSVGSRRQTVLHQPGANRPGEADAPTGTREGNRVCVAGRFCIAGWADGRHHRAGRPAVRRRAQDDRAFRRGRRQVHRS